MKIIIFYKKRKRKKNNENYTFTLYLCYTYIYGIIPIFDITFAATSFLKKINTFIILKVSSYKNFPAVGAKNIKIIMNFYKK